jgi:3-phenylpropionate/cinnamic acid dioxygenase small subunit
MQVGDDGDEDHGVPPRPPGHSLASAIVSGDSDENIFDETTDDEESVRLDPSKNQDELYDQNLDEEDEAYVYKHLRGGMRETVTVLQKETAEDGQPQATTRKQIQVFRPRTSDAVLSCPCCFNIVCMDCQRHQRYLNQYRAMFVMGITVDWHSRLIYNEVQQALVPKEFNVEEELPNQVPLESSMIGETTNVPPSYKEGEYFSVQCANCNTQVAALDMNEEVYYFHGCLESS